MSLRSLEKERYIAKVLQKSKHNERELSHKKTFKVLNNLLTESCANDEYTSGVSKNEYFNTKSDNPVSADPLNSNKLRLGKQPKNNYGIRGRTIDATQQPNTKFRFIESNTSYNTKALSTNNNEVLNTSRDHSQSAVNKSTDWKFISKLKNHHTPLL